MSRVEKNVEGQFFDSIKNCLQIFSNRIKYLPLHIRITINLL